MPRVRHRWNRSFVLTAGGAARFAARAACPGACRWCLWPEWSLYLLIARRKPVALIFWCTAPVLLAPIGMLISYFAAICAKACEHSAAPAGEPRPSDSPRMKPPRFAHSRRAVFAYHGAYRRPDRPLKAGGAVACTTCGHARDAVLKRREARAR